MKTEKIKAAAQQANTAKSVLIKIASELEQYAPGKAKSLSSIIARLEAWQHTK